MQIVGVAFDRAAGVARDNERSRAAPTVPAPNRTTWVSRRPALMSIAPPDAPRVTHPDCCGRDHRELVLDRVQFHTDTGCWIWRNKPDSTGYGRIQHQRGRIERAHRFSYAAFVGPIPDGLVLDHLCRVTLCVNPEHLEPVTQGENTRRAFAIEGAVVTATECLHGHQDRRPRGRDRGTYCRECRLQNYRRGLPEGDARHGTPGGYSNYGCHCGPCTDAIRAVRARTRARKRAVV